MNIALVVGAIVVYLFSIRLVEAAVTKVGDRKRVSVFRIRYVIKTINLGLAVLFLIITTTLLGIEYSQITIFLSSVFAVVGVALFAQWSILSNITASLIIFFGFPYRVGDAIKVVDKEENVFGIVEEITLFHVLIRRGDELITYPNSLILQKPVIKLKSIETLMKKSEIDEGENK